MKLLASEKKKKDKSHGYLLLLLLLEVEHCEANGHEPCSEPDWMGRDADTPTIKQQNQMFRSRIMRILFLVFKLGNRILRKQIRTIRNGKKSRAVHRPFYLTNMGYFGSAGRKILQGSEM